MLLTVHQRHYLKEFWLYIYITALVITNRKETTIFSCYHLDLISFSPYEALPTLNHIFSFTFKTFIKRSLLYLYQNIYRDWPRTSKEHKKNIIHQTHIKSNKAQIYVVHLVHEATSTNFVFFYFWLESNYKSRYNRIHGRLPCLKSPHRDTLATPTLPLFRASMTIQESIYSSLAQAELWL